MRSTLKTYLIAGLLAVPAIAATDAMPAAQQNALVGKYCAVCHTDAHPNGRLSLQHFDAARPDPGVVAMVLSKVKAGAFSAAGLPIPDKATQGALRNALTAEAAGADKWTFNRTQKPATNAPILTASLVRTAASTDKENEGEPDVYRLVLTCREDRHEAEIQLTWSPGVPPTGRSMSVAVDGKQPVTYKVEGSEKMGNGQEGTSGPGAILLHGLATALPEKTLSVSNVFGDEKVAFPFDELNQKARRTLSACMAKSHTEQ